MKTKVKNVEVLREERQEKIRHTTDTGHRVKIRHCQACCLERSRKGEES